MDKVRIIPGEIFIGKGRRNTTVSTGPQVLRVYQLDTSDFLYMQFDRDINGYDQTFAQLTVNGTSGGVFFAIGNDTWVFFDSGNWFFNQCGFAWTLTITPPGMQEQSGTIEINFPIFSVTINDLQSVLINTNPLTPGNLGGNGPGSFTINGVPADTFGDGGDTAILASSVLWVLLGGETWIITPPSNVQFLPPFTGLVTV